MDLKMISFCSLGICIGVFVLVAFYKKWNWYMNNYQSRPMRKMWGEAGFALYTHAVCVGLIGLGLNGLAGELF